MAHHWSATWFRPGPRPQTQTARSGFELTNHESTGTPPTFGGILTVYYELIMWPANRWLDSSVGRALHRYRRGHGFGSRSGLYFFRLNLFHNHLSCVYNHDDQSCLHIFLRSSNIFQIFICILKFECRAFEEFLLVPIIQSWQFYHFECNIDCILF